MKTDHEGVSSDTQTHSVSLYFSRREGVPETENQSGLFLTTLDKNEREIRQRERSLETSECRFHQQDFVTDRLGDGTSTSQVEGWSKPRSDMGVSGSE